MQRLIALLSSNLCTVLMLVLLMFLALPLAFAQPVHESTASSLHSQHKANTAATMDCEADCAGTVHYCCLYALFADSTPILFQPHTAHRSTLAYFFNSRHIAPLTQPPKIASS